MLRSERTGILLKRLPQMYPNAKCMLISDGNPFHLLIATILSARTTDESVNRVTPELWAAFHGPPELASAERASVENIVHPLGFFRNKSTSIMNAASWVADHDGVPQTMDELLEIPGVGRKTASVVLADAFGIPAIIVDTHVGRLSYRLDLSRKTNPERIETDLKRLLPRVSWISFCHQIGYHGRRVCKSRKPDCNGCTLNDICPRRGLKNIRN